MGDGTVPDAPRRSGDATVLGIDLGQGSSRALLVHAGSQTTATGPGYWDGPLEVVMATVARAALSAAGLHRPRLHVGVGMSGFDRSASPARRVHEALAPLAEPVSTTVADDSLSSYLGALGSRAGAVIAAGTGSVALALDPGRIAARSDGWGSDLGDHGAGYWIGRQAVQAALRAYDRGTIDGLTGAVIARWGPIEALAEAWRRDHPGPAAVAGFAETVADQARAGHQPTLEIWAAAGRLLAETVAIALARAGLSDAAVPVATTGGVFRAGAIVAEPFRMELASRAPAAIIVPASAGSVEGSLVLPDLEVGPWIAALADRHVEGAR